jgi:kynureninase
MSTLSQATLRRLDREDPLRAFRRRFFLPGPGVYLCGNSLGPLPRATPERLHQVLREEWGRQQVAGWNRSGWFHLAGQVGEKIGRLLGARPGEVMVADSLSVNLFKLLAAARTLRPGRRVLLTEEENFPSDLYMAQGLTALLADGTEVRVVPRHRLLEALSPEVAAVFLSHVGFRDGALWDLPRVTRQVQACGALMLWDVAHSAGVLPLRLAAAGVDLAVGCGYKYLNGGPGAPAFLYVAEAHHGRWRQPLQGWFGHARPFALEEEFEPAPGVVRGQCGTPPILSLAALEVGCDLLLEADLEQVADKGRRLGEVFLALVNERCPDLGLELASPADADQRGSQLCWRHPQAHALCQALIERGIVGDFRDPDILRFGLSPLILRYQDLWTAVEALRDLLVTEAWNDPRFHQRQAVT